jgi:hypothetical protein
MHTVIAGCNCCTVQFKLVSKDVFDQFKKNGVLDPAVDVAYNPLHHGKAVLLGETLLCGTVAYCLPRQSTAWRQIAATGGIRARGVFVAAQEAQFMHHQQLSKECQLEVIHVSSHRVVYQYACVSQPAANAGLATPVAAYYKAKIYANTEVGLWDASFADIVAYGALLGLARCDGPHVSTACLQYPCTALYSLVQYVWLYTAVLCLPAPCSAVQSGACLHRMWLLLAAQHNAQCTEVKGPFFFPPEICHVAAVLMGV